MKIVLPCRRELNIQGPGVIEIVKKNRIKTALDCGVVVGSHFWTKISAFYAKSDSQMDTEVEPKLPRWVDGTPDFHPWVHKVAQVVPNCAQSDSKGAQRLPKWS